MEEIVGDDDGGWDRWSQLVAVSIHCDDRSRIGGRIKEIEK